MITQARQEILAVIREILELDPDVRVGQLMVGMGVIGEANAGRGLYHLDDEELLDALCEHRNNLRKRRTNVAAPLLRLAPPDADASSPSASAGQSQ